MCSPDVTSGLTPEQLEGLISAISAGILARAGQVTHTIGNQRFEYNQTELPTALASLIALRGAANGPIVLETEGY